MSIGEMNREAVNFEEEFYKLVEKADKETQATPGFKKLVAEAEDEGDYAGGFEKIRKFLAKRREALEKTTIVMAEGTEPMMENIQRDIDNILLASSDPERFIGNGAVAEVFYLRGAHTYDCCVKLVKDEQRYAEGNTLDQEFRFLKMLQNLQVAGVRIPKPYYSFFNMRAKGIVMEELDAFNFRRIIEGQTTAGVKDELPEGFDVDDFFSKLKEFMKEMHKQGIYHGDVALRNLMIDRKTGLPYVIDFGKARLESELDKTNVNLPDYAASDLAALESARVEAKNWISGGKKPQK